MKMNWHNKLALLPLLACSALSWANEPILLNEPDMDRITAGTQPILERFSLEQLASALAKLGNAAGPMFTNLSPVQANQLDQITQLASRDLEFRSLDQNMLVATQQLPSGEQLVFLKQLTAAGTATLPQSLQNGVVTARLLQPGEVLRIQQTSTNGINYSYIQSSGGATVAVFQRSF